MSAATSACAGGAVAFETGDDALPVGDRAILRKLPLADEPRHRNLHADDGAEQLFDVLGGRIAHVPGIGARLLVTIASESSTMLPQPGGVMHDVRSAVRMHGHVVPGRHDFAVLLLRRVPAR